jgi:hypothetical protein
MADGVPLIVYSGGITRARAVETAIAALPQLPDVHLAVVTSARLSGQGLAPPAIHPTAQALLGAMGNKALVQRRTFFYHRARFARPDAQAELKIAITTALETAKGRHGHRRVYAVLVRQGWLVAKRTVLKLMRRLGLECPVRRKNHDNSYQARRAGLPRISLPVTSPNAPNQKWVTDVSELGIGDRKVYLSPVMDLFDRQIIA